MKGYMDLADLEEDSGGKQMKHPVMFLGGTIVAFLAAGAHWVGSSIWITLALLSIGIYIEAGCRLLAELLAATPSAQPGEGKSGEAGE